MNKEKMSWPTIKEFMELCRARRTGGSTPRVRKLYLEDRKACYSSQWNCSDTEEAVSGQQGVRADQYVGSGMLKLPARRIGSESEAILGLPIACTSKPTFCK